MIRINVVVVVLLSLISSIECVAQMNKVDTKHVADDAFFVLRLDVERITSHLKDSRKDFEKISAMIKQESGIDIANLKCLTLQFGDPNADDPDPSFAMTLEFKKDFDRKTILSDFSKRRSFEKTTINGKEYMKADVASGPHLYFESDRKFTAATMSGINSVLNGGGGMGQVASQLKSAPPGSELVAVFRRTEKFKDTMGFIAGSLNEVMGPVSLEDLIEQGQSGFAVLNLADGVPISVQFELNTADAATKLNKNLDLLVAMGKTLAGPAKEQLQEQVKALGDAEGFEGMQRNAMEVGVKGLIVGEKILGGMKITTKNKTVDIKVKRMGGIVELADLLIFGSQMFVMGTSSAIEKGPAPAIRRIEEKVERAPIIKGK